MMKYIVIGLLLFFVFVLLICYFFRRRWAIRKVKWATDIQKLCTINAILEPFGFKFNLENDIVISKCDAWQRNMGYRDLYDAKAPFFHMVFDALPIHFRYHNKDYRLEFWKGQYGITTGAEIGLYVKDENTSFYRAASDQEQLEMNFVLFKKCRLFSRCDTCWWLTGFQVGLFSWPHDLKLSICIKFPDCEMRDAFLCSLIDSGYSRANIEICDNIVCFHFCSSSNYKPNRTHKIIKCIAQFFNYINCGIYNKLTRPFNRTIDKLMYLRYMAPCLYRFIIRRCVPRRRKKCYCKK